MESRALLRPFGFSLLAFMAAASGAKAAGPPPHLEKRDTATQSIVDGQPFLALAGETNSSTSGLDYMRPLWPKWSAANFNTILAPVSWELVEPEEGKLDFATVDGLIQDARRNRLHLVQDQERPPLHNQLCRCASFLEVRWGTGHFVRRLASPRVSAVRQARQLPKPKRQSIGRGLASGIIT